MQEVFPWGFRHEWAFIVDEFLLCICIWYLGSLITKAHSGLLVCQFAFARLFKTLLDRQLQEGIGIISNCLPATGGFDTSSERLQHTKRNQIKQKIGENPVSCQEYSM